jgi:hypothetical protein
VDEIISKHQNEAERFRAGEDKPLAFSWTGDEGDKGKGNPRC